MAPTFCGQSTELILEVSKFSFLTFENILRNQNYLPVVELFLNLLVTLGGETGK